MDIKELPDSYKHIRSETARAVDEKSSIEFSDVADINFAVNLIGDILKEKKLRHIVVTNNRSAIPKVAAGGGAAVVGASVAMEVAAVAAPVVVGTVAMAGAAVTGVGLVALAGFAAHRLMNPSPDYELTKYPSEKKLVLTYKK